MEERAARAEQYLREKEAELRAKDKQLEQLKEQMFKDSQVRAAAGRRRCGCALTALATPSQSLFALRQEEASLIAQISGAQAASKNLSAQIQKLDAESLRQQELIYSGEFQIQHMERKVARASGVRSDEEKKALNARIQELSEELDAHRAEHSMLQAQSKKLGEELRSANRTLDSLRREKERVDVRGLPLSLPLPLSLATTATSLSRLSLTHTHRL